MTTRTPQPIPIKLKTRMAALLHDGVLVINEVMDIYRKRAQVSHNDLEHLAGQLGDPALAIGHTTWLNTVTGRGGVYRAPSPEVLAAFIYLLDLDLIDLNLDPTQHRVVASVVDALKSGRVAA